MPTKPFTNFPKELDNLILEYLPFQDLTRIVESSPSTDLLHKLALKNILKQYPDYVNLPAAKAQGNYELLIANFKKIFSTIGFTTIELDLEPNEETFKMLCGKSAARLSFILDNDFYRRNLTSEVQPLFLRDFIFYLCQYNSISAGEVLNKHIWRVWKSDITDYLIRYGADVNVISPGGIHTTLFIALRWGTNVNIIQNIIENGLHYDAYQQQKDNITYNYMLIAGLAGHTEGLKLLLNYFPEKITESLKEFRKMVLLTTQQNFSRDFGDFTLHSQSEFANRYFSVEEIRRAKSLFENLVFLNKSNIPKTPSFKRLRDSFFSHPESENTFQDSNQKKFRL